jgi:hypothetical protein
MSARQKLMRVLECWPANLPDLNQMEMLWAVVAQKLVAANTRTGGRDFAEVERVWKRT